MHHLHVRQMDRLVLGVLLDKQAWFLGVSQFVFHCHVASIDSIVSIASCQWNWSSSLKLFLFNLVNFNQLDQLCHSLWFTASCIEIHLYSNVLDKSKAYLRWVYWDSYSYIPTRWINSAYSYLRWLCWDSFSYPLDEPNVHAYSYLRWIYWDSTSYLLDKSKVHSPVEIHFHIY